jgi:hypothetical protein
LSFFQKQKESSLFVHAIDFNFFKGALATIFIKKKSCFGNGTLNHLYKWVPKTFLPSGKQVNLLISNSYILPLISEGYLQQQRNDPETEYYLSV